MLFFFKQKTAYEMRISDWSSDVCSSDLITFRRFGGGAPFPGRRHAGSGVADEVGFADVGAGLAQDVVGGGAVEEQVRDDEVQQVGLAFEIHLAVAHLPVEIGRA